LAPQIDYSVLPKADKTIFLARTRLIRTPKEWELTAPELLAEARATRFLSVDTESLGRKALMRLADRREAQLAGTPLHQRKDELAWELDYDFSAPELQQVYVLLGTLSGRVAVLDLRWLRKNLRDGSEQADMN
jgi:hypothetical protein